MEGDERPLNVVTVKVSFSTRNIKNMLDSLNGFEYFTGLVGFFWILWYPSCCWKQAQNRFYCNGRSRIYRWTTSVRRVLRTYKRARDVSQTHWPPIRRHFKKFCLLYSNDFLVYFNGPVFLCQRKKILVSASNLGTWNYMDKTKILAANNFSGPHKSQTIRKWLGLTNYFCRFIQYYDTIAEPPTNCHF